eukprot:7828154-Heterocapsa_arctica.AAC.1
MRHCLHVLFCWTRNTSSELLDAVGDVRTYLRGVHKLADIPSEGGMLGGCQARAVNAVLDAHVAGCCRRSS